MPSGVALLKGFARTSHQIIKTILQSLVSESWPGCFLSERDELVPLSCESTAVLSGPDTRQSVHSSESA